jgi:multiple sugar transport system substrate-binding protein
MANRKPSRKTFRLRLNEMVSSLREEILTGRRKPGEFLPSETDLGETFGLSRNSVRIGLNMLIEEALIEKVPKVGNRVRETSSPQPLTIRFGYYPSMLIETNLHELVERFNEENPEIRVLMVPIHYDTFVEAVPDYFKDGMLDLVTINYNNYQQWLDNGYAHMFEPLQPNEQLYPFLTQAFRRDGEQRIQPFVASPVILCYNKDHFQERGIPEPDSSWSWDDLIRHAAAVRAGTDRYGIYFHLSSEHRWPIFLLQSGMRFQRLESGGYDFSDERLWEGLALSKKLIHEQTERPAFLSDNDSDAELLFLQEKVSIIITTYYGLNTLAKAKFRFDVAPLPRSRSAKTLMTVIGLAVNKDSKSKEAALSLAQYLISYQAQLEIRRKTLTIPSHKQAAEWEGKETMYRPSRFFLYREIVPTFAYISELGLSLDELVRLKIELKLYWSNLETREQLEERLRRVFGH